MVLPRVLAPSVRLEHNLLELLPSRVDELLLPVEAEFNVVGVRPPVIPRPQLFFYEEHHGSRVTYDDYCHEEIQDSLGPHLRDSVPVTERGREEASVHASGL